MKKTLLVAIIAIVLVASVVGGCFALYSTNATQKTVNISAGNTNVDLLINDATNEDTFTLSDMVFDPVNNTQTINAVLHITNSQLADGVHGNFQAIVGEDLAPYLDVTVSTLTAVGGSVDENITADATGAGYDVALSDTPVAVRIVLALKAAYIENFAAAADKTASITLNWAPVAFTYDANAYYAVGVLNGSAVKWEPSSSSIVLDSEVSSGNVAQKNAVALKAGDTFKVVKNYRAGDGNWVWPATQYSNSTVEGVTVSADGANIQITADGIYYIFVNTSGQVWVDTHA